ncbi:hypothetical protein NDU88_009251 [Pleurodeles waltl]|uniref:Uncharacterized protein n=1 Tax=Pleurodeles waltl TaxID=8319 RepID=A0AAV7RXU0_PLEWA|nr:hypothetical protein NDU88_009251 [Pleurodeles waltl]
MESNVLRLGKILASPRFREATHSVLLSCPLKLKDLKDLTSDRVPRSMQSGGVPEVKATLGLPRGGATPPVKTVSRSFSTGKQLTLRSGSQLDSETVRKWEQAGFRKILHFFAGDSWEMLPSIAL